MKPITDLAQTFNDKPSCPTFELGTKVEKARYYANRHRANPVASILTGAATVSPSPVEEDQDEDGRCHHSWPWV
jgi:hypothetical protein